MIDDVSQSERAIRAGGGSLVGLLGRFLPMRARPILVPPGLVGPVTGLSGFCPACRLMGRGGAGRA